ncbi:MAG: AMP-binding protein, partial [bacterium]|nr:AMP-binding protein [bacterium]
MTLVQLLGRLNKMGVELRWEGDSLKISSPKGKLTPELFAELKEKKVELIEFLKKYEDTDDRAAAVLEPVEEKEYYPLSSPQKRLFVLQRMDPENSVYNIPSVLVLQGEPDRLRLEAGLKKMIHRHDILRTFFRMLNGEPIQTIPDDVEFNMQYHELTDEDASLYASALEQHASAWVSRFIRPFDLSVPPLLRVSLLKIEKEKSLLMMDMHHIVSDGTSMNIFIREWVAFYNGEEPTELKIQYKDFSQWQNSQVFGDHLKEQETYWLETFREESPALMLPLDYPRPPVQEFAGGTRKFQLGAMETKALKQLALDNEMTLYMVLLAIYHIFLSRISGQEDIVIGTPVAGRNHADLGEVIGMFVNTLALRNRFRPDVSVGGFLRDVKENTLNAFNNQDYQYEELVERVVVNRDAGRNPLFDVMFALQNLDFTPVEIPGLRLLPCSFEKKVSKFDLSLYAAQIEDTMSFCFEYGTGLFKAETIERFEGFLSRVVTSVTSDGSRGVSQIEIISEMEKERLLNRFNDTSCDFPRDKTLHGLIEEQVEKIPDDTALIWTSSVCGTTSPACLTYRELNRRAERLAGLLRSMGTGPDSIVPLAMERSPEMIVGIMGILQAGAAYLPMEPESPAERFRFLLADSSAGLLLSLVK